MESNRKRKNEDVKYFINSRISKLTRENPSNVVDSFIRITDLFLNMLKETKILLPQTSEPKDYIRLFMRETRELVDKEIEVLPEYSLVDTWKTEHEIPVV